MIYVSCLLSLPRLWGDLWCVPRPCGVLLLASGEARAWAGEVSVQMKVEAFVSECQIEIRIFPERRPEHCRISRTPEVESEVCRRSDPVSRPRRHGTGTRTVDFKAEARLTLRG